MRRGCLPYPRRTSDHHSAENVHTLFSWFFEICFAIRSPKKKVSAGRKETGEEDVPAVQPILQFFNLSLIPTNLFRSPGCISRRPELSRRIRSFLARHKIRKDRKKERSTKRTNLTPVACFPFSLFSNSFAPCLMTSCSFSIFFLVFASKSSPTSLVAINFKNSSSLIVVRPCFLMAASFEGPALEPRTTKFVTEEGWVVTRLKHVVRSVRIFKKEDAHTLQIAWRDRQLHPSKKYPAPRWTRMQGP